MIYVAGRALGRLLCEALNIDPFMCTDIKIECSIDGAAKVTVGQLVSDGDAAAMVEAVNVFGLVNISDTQGET